MKKIGFWAGLFLITLTINTFGQGVPKIRTVPFITGLSLPVHVTNAKDGTKRLFIVQQRGIIKVVQPGSNTTTDFLNVSSVVSSSGSERGLLGLAFHPQYASNRRFFIYYTRQSDGAIQIAEYETNAANPNQANPNAVRTILTIPHPISNHNGGTILFGPDGYLYAGTGDGGGGNDTSNNAQNINSLLGKFLRIDINTPVGQVPAYNIPPTNPYAGATPGLDEIYAIGMRNPYRFSFDRGGTNQLWVGDVGQDAIEEVDIITLGGNYGWRVYEGNQCTNNDPGLCTPSNYLPPVFQYVSASPNPRCSVTGGYVYRGTQNALPVGSYIYADYCTGEILLWHNNTQTLLLDTSRTISSFGEDESGEIYITGLASGTVDKIVAPKAPADFDGDGKTDVSIWRAPSGSWWYLHSSDLSGHGHSFGLPDDIITPGDYTGDGKTDVAVWRPSTAEWFVRRSEDGSYYSYPFGLPGDIPASADFDGDGITDTATFRPSTATWYIFFSTNNTFGIVTFGLDGDKPVPADYDGDAKADIMVWRPSNGTWWIVRSSDLQQRGYGFGLGTDKPVVGDYTGDGKADIAVYRPSTSEWYFLRSEDGSYYSYPSGLPGDIPAPGDYDGDGRFDSAVFRPSTQTWFIDGSTAGSMILTFGLDGDRPVANAYVP